MELHLQAHHAHPQGTGPAPQNALSDLPHRPYTYQGTDFSVPATLAEVITLPRRPRPHPPTPLELLTHEVHAAGLPVSAPPDWIREYEMAARGEL